MQTGSEENISAKNNHMLHVLKNLYSQTEGKGRLSWRARASFQTEWLLGEGIIQMFSWHICVSSQILEEKSGRPTLVPRVASAPGGRPPGCPGSVESPNSGNSIQVWIAAPGWWGPLQPVKNSGIMAEAWQWPLRTSAFCRMDHGLYLPGQRLTKKDGFLSLFKILAWYPKTGWFVINSTVKI